MTENIIIALLGFLATIGAAWLMLLKERSRPVSAVKIDEATIEKLRTETRNLLEAEINQYIKQNADLRRDLEKERRLRDEEHRETLVARDLADEKIAALSSELAGLQILLRDYAEGAPRLYDQFVGKLPGVPAAWTPPARRLGITPSPEADLGAS